MRRLAVERRKEADPIGCWLRTDQRLVMMKGPMSATYRMSILGNALLEVIEANRPMFHYSVVGGRVMMTEGTTIFVTGRTKGDGETLVVTWDAGERAIDVVGQMARTRRLIAELPSEVTFQLLKAAEFPNLPPPQALISDCILANEKEPQTSLFGCGAGAPISIAVGVEKTHVVMDHRLFDPRPHMRNLVEGFEAAIAMELGEWEMTTNLNGVAQ